MTEILPLQLVRPQLAWTKDSQLIIHDRPVITLPRHLHEFFDQRCLPVVMAVIHLLQEARPMLTSPVSATSFERLPTACQDDSSSFNRHISTNGTGTSTQHGAQAASNIDPARNDDGHPQRSHQHVAGTPRYGQGDRGQQNGNQYTGGTSRTGGGGGQHTHYRDGSQRANNIREADRHGRPHHNTRDGGSRSNRAAGIEYRRRGMSSTILTYWE
jgi:hypothetical protein